MKCENCGNCRFVKSVMGGLFCRRYPPTVQMGFRPDPLLGQPRITIESHFPPIQKDGWCGEWLPEMEQ